MTLGIVADFLLLIWNGTINSIAILYVILMCHRELYYSVTNIL
jgi:hypothetical protein